METAFSSNRAYFSVNPSFRLVEISFLSIGNSIVLLRVFFLPLVNITEIWEGQILMAIHISASGHQLFSILSDIC